MVKEKCDICGSKASFAYPTDDDYADMCEFCAEGDYWLDETVDNEQGGMWIRK